MAKRFAAFSLVPLAMLCLGLGALAAPAPLRGPLVLDLSANPTSGGLWLLSQSVFLADAIGLGLLLLATLAIWVIAIAWEVRRHET